jgi:single-strand DNA-binding protein
MARTAPPTSPRAGPVAVDGRLEWREWEDQNANERQAVDIIADTVQFLGSRPQGENDGRSAPASAIPTGDFGAAPASAGPDDDIPF